MVPWLFGWLYQLNNGVELVDGLLEGDQRSACRRVASAVAVAAVAATVDVLTVAKNLWRLLCFYI